MKSHSLAKELIALGEAILRAPNMDTSALRVLDANLIGERSENDAEMAFGITTLAQLSKHSRSEWIKFSEDHSIPLVYNERDSARNVMGKIMSYLANNETEIVRVRDSVKQAGGSSNRLNQALTTLLKGY